MGEYKKKIQNKKTEPGSALQNAKLHSINLQKKEESEARLL